MDRKQELIQGLTAARQRILDLVASVPPDKLDEVFLGVWSVKDLLAHLIGWDQANIEAVGDIRAGLAPRVFKHWDPEWANYNAELVRRQRRERLDEMLADMHVSHAALLECLAAVPPHEVDQDFGIRSPSGANITVGWFLQFEIDDEGQHADQIQAWRDRNLG